MMRTDSDDAYASYRQIRYFGSLNGLRFLCIVAVMWHHSPARVSLQDAPTILLRGFAGVDFFFVLSGFLITTLLLREEARRGIFSLSGFYWRRVLRIVPPYFLLITLAAGYFVLIKGKGDLAPLVPYYYLFLSNMLKSDIPLLSVTWSLAVEEQYYLLWPLILLLLPKIGRWRAYVLLGLIALCVAAGEGLFRPLGFHPIETEYAIWALPATSYAAILIGSLSAVLLHRRRGFAVLYRLVGHGPGMIAAFAALVLLLSTLPGDLTGWPSLLLHVAMALCLISIVIREEHLLAPVLRRPLIARIGEISYGLYLYHLIGRHIAVEGLTAIGLQGPILPWLQSLLFVPISIMIAEISYRYFESYFLTLKSRPAPTTG